MAERINCAQAYGAIAPRAGPPDPAAAASGVRMIAVCVAALLLAACGSEPTEKPHAFGATPAAAGKDPSAPGGPVMVGDWLVLGENPKWKPVAPLFESYVHRDINAVWNPMLSNLTDFVVRPLVESADDTAVGPDGEAAPGGKDLTQCSCPASDPKCAAIPAKEREPLASYQLVLLLTGLPTPKALVVDVQGEQYEIQRGDSLGCEGGRVDQITQYRVFVSVPGKERKVELSIAPPLTRVEEKAGQQNGAL